MPECLSRYIRTTSSSDVDGQVLNSPVCRLLPRKGCRRRRGRRAGQRVMGDSGGNGPNDPAQVEFVGPHLPALPREGRNR